MEALAPRWGEFDPGFIPMSYQGWFGNFGILPAADTLPEAERMKVYTLAKETLPRLEESLRTSEVEPWGAAKSIRMIRQATEPGWAWRPLAATSEKGGQRWRYLMWNTPEKTAVEGEADVALQPAAPPAEAANWFAPDFDDSPWKTGEAPFGVGRVERPELPAVANRTEWTSERILLRREFDLEETEGLLEFRLRALSREGMEVYLNGQEVLDKNAPARKAGSDRPEYVTHELPYGAIMKALKKGKNVIAVSTYVTYLKGKPVGQIDVGLEAVRKSNQKIEETLKR
jgi:hypothetical protein